MQTTRTHMMVAKPSDADQPIVSHDGTYRVLGIALASAVSAGFWVAVLAFLLPGIGIVLAAPALILAGLAIASFVPAVLFFLTGGH